jgi:hypothetical protein
MVGMTPLVGALVHLSCVIHGAKLSLAPGGLRIRETPVSAHEPRTGRPGIDEAN